MITLSFLFVLQVFYYLIGTLGALASIWMFVQYVKKRGL